MPTDALLTAFSITHLEGRVNYRLLFGAPDKVIRINRARSIAVFRPQRNLGYLRWRANEYGTQVWRGFVVKTGSADEDMTKIPGVSPGVRLILSTRGKTYTKRFLGFLDTLKINATELEFISESYWRHLHLSIQLNRAPHDLHQRQEAQLKRLAMMP